VVLPADPSDDDVAASRAASIFAGRLKRVGARELIPSLEPERLEPKWLRTSQILGTISRFSETFLAEREGESLGDPPGP
jgi:hypothetical protein